MVLFIMSLAVAFFSIIAPKNKIQTVILLILTWLMIALNFANPDYHNYEVLYSQIQVQDIKFTLDSEWLFSLLMICSKQIGFSFQYFYAFLGFLYVVMLELATKRLTTYKNIVLVLHFFLVLPLSIVQIRSGLGLVIVFWGMTILFDESIEMRKSILGFILIVLLASLIHQSSLSFIIILFARIFNKKTCIVLTVLGVGLSQVLICV